VRQCVRDLARHGAPCVAGGASTGRTVAVDREVDRVALGEVPTAGVLVGDVCAALERVVVDFDHEVLVIIWHLEVFKRVAVGTTGAHAHAATRGVLNRKRYCLR